VFGAAAGAGGAESCAKSQRLKAILELDPGSDVGGTGSGAIVKGPPFSERQLSRFKIVLRRRSPACTPADRASSFGLFSMPAALGV